MFRRQAFVLTALAMVALCRTAGATGLLIPEDRKLPPLAVQSHRVSARVEGNVATTHVTEVFLNSTNRRLEATFIFPVPREAALTDFAMFINGKRESGEVVEADKARQVYEDIVRRLRDPGLLEYLDSGLLRMRVFPIEPNSSVKLEVSYTHALPFESGVYEYTFPLKAGNKASKVLEDFTLSVDIASRQPIKSVYSPTHDVGITRKDDHHALVGFEQTGVMLDTDFTLFYTVSREDFGLNLLTHRLEGEDGYFAVMISPRVEMGEDKVMAKDVCFVIDTSGSMQQENRIGAARDAVTFCLKALNPRDRFALVTFSTGVEVFGGGLTEATPEAVPEAVAHVEKLEARGGTALYGATLEALGMAPEEGRPYLVVLATDGKPTVFPADMAEPEKFIAKMKDANRANARVFTFGIAESLDVPLLDKIAEATGGYGEYIAPGREIETKISAFFRKVSHPVLSGLKLGFGEVEVGDVYPQQIPDLFRGSQVIAFGRYSGDGEVAVALTGNVEGETKEFAYDATFPKVQAANDFLPQLWARRKIGYLLDQIRLHGKSDELVEEVVRLSKDYGIATPFTSYLVLENADAYRQHGIIRDGSVRRLQTVGVPMTAPSARPEEARERAAADFLMQDREMLGEAGGRGSAAGPAGARKAISLSTRLSGWKDSDALAPAGESVEAKIQRVGARTFVLLGGTYIDTAFEEDMEILKLKWGGDAYFNVLTAMPELKDCLVLGESVVIVIGKKALVIADEGSEEMSADAVKAFFAR
jgi:Ca-activated chloride channel family protein